MKLSIWREDSGGKKTYENEVIISEHEIEEMVIEKYGTCNPYMLEYCDYYAKIECIESENKEL